MKPYGYIYLITNIQNRKMYCGQTTQKNVVGYIQNHFKNAYQNKDNGTRHLYNAIRQYGKQNFKYTILGECNSQKELNESEVAVIYHYRLFSIYQNGKQHDGIYGYNLTEGAEHGIGRNFKMFGKSPWNRGLSKETDERIKKYGENVSKTKISQHICQSAESNLKRSKTCKISLNTPEMKTHFSKIRSGVPKSEQHKKHMSESQTGINSSVRRFDLDNKISEIIIAREKGLSYNKIAKIYDCSVQAIVNRLNNKIALVGETNGLY